MTAQPSESISLRTAAAYMQWQSSYGAMSSEEDSHDAAKLLNDGRFHLQVLSITIACIISLSVVGHPLYPPLLL